MAHRRFGRVAVCWSNGALWNMNFIFRDRRRQVIRSAVRKNTFMFHLTLFTQKASGAWETTSRKTIYQGRCIGSMRCCSSLTAFILITITDKYHSTVLPKGSFPENFLTFFFFYSHKWWHPLVYIHFTVIASEKEVMFSPLLVFVPCLFVCQQD